VGFLRPFCRAGDKSVVRSDNSAYLDDEGDPMSRERVMAKFPARFKDSGEEVLIYVFQEETLSYSLEETSVLPGPTRYETDKGQRIKKLGKGRYADLAGKELVSDSPDA